jgi:hypothetical protein
MTLKEVILKVPITIRETVAKELLNLIICSEDVDKLPEKIRESISVWWQRDLLPSHTCLERLLEAAILLEPEKTYNLFAETLKLHEIATMLRYKVLKGFYKFVMIRK